MKKLWCGILSLVSAVFLGAMAMAEADLLVRNVVSGEEKQLGQAEILEFEQIEISTANEFIDGTRLFKGPLMREVLNMCGAGNAHTVRLIAANDYQVEINTEEFLTYDVILAHSVDGEPLSRRDKGPLWLIYPMSDNPELEDPVFNSRLIWQVVRVEYW